MGWGVEEEIQAAFAASSVGASAAAAPVGGDVGATSAPAVPVVTAAAVSGAGDGAVDDINGKKSVKQENSGEAESTNNADAEKAGSGASSGERKDQENSDAGNKTASGGVGDADGPVGSKFADTVHDSTRLLQKS